MCVNYTYTEREAAGYTLGEIEVEGQKKIIISIQDIGVRLCVGDPVVSKGLFYHKKGVRGKVVRIKEPFTGDNTSNVIVVAWENGSRVHMKFEDIIFEPRFTLDRKSG